MKRRFETQFFFDSRQNKRPAAKGFTDDLSEAKGNLARQVGRGHYAKGIIIDRHRLMIVWVYVRLSDGTIQFIAPNKHADDEYVAMMWCRAATKAIRLSPAKRSINRSRK